MRAFYSDRFVLPLPQGHRFPMAKYALLREHVVGGGVVTGDDLCVPEAATDAELERVHEPRYVRRMTAGAAGGPAMRRIGFPWSPELVERSRRSVGATLAACRAALEEGTAVNLAGGTHHAGVAHGEGFCVFNDVAVAARALQVEGLADRVMVVDLDVHQGNGTGEIFRDDPTVFTFDMHGARNFPFAKGPADVNLPLRDDAGDQEYCAALEEHLARALDAFAPDFVIYVSGADPYAGDRLGRLALSHAGLASRDEYVLAEVRRRGVPVAVTMAGGYAREIADTVAIHLATVRCAARWNGGRPGPPSQSA